MVKRYLVMLMLGFFALMAVGCCPITKLNITVDMDENLRSQLGSRMLNLDIVALTPNESQRYENYSMSQYWDNNDALRASLKGRMITLTLDPKRPGSQTVWASDPVWNRWLKGSNEKEPPLIYVLALLPGTWGTDNDKNGDQDPRRLILPTASCRWDNSAGMPPNVKIVVTSNGLTTQTQQVRDKAK
jgi:hypothetical protein